MTTLVFSVVFGSIGVGYFIYGRKQQRLIPLIAGMGLFAVPYLIPDPYVLALAGALLAAAPWALKK